MAPSVPRHDASDFATTSEDLKAQWVLPKDIFSVLLLLGGEVISRALAQLAGHGLAPVTFSFGWVAYSISALVSAVGENKLMPAPDCKCKLINGKTRFINENSSWVLGRLVRDFGTWCHDATREKLSEVLDDKWAQLKQGDSKVARPTRAGLIVSVYKPSANGRAEKPRRDYIYWSGIIIMVLQLVTAALPFALSGNWGILMITIVGTGLALVTGLLPQWKKEKWACRTRSKATYILTRGNGAQHCIVILGNGHGLDLEDLAAGQSNMDASANNSTRAAILGLSVAWVFLLITAAGLKESTWFLLAVGGIGTLQNIVVAGSPRRPESFGIPLDFVQVFGRTKVMLTLLDVEEAYPMVGRSMRDEFFPGSIKDDEEKLWGAVCMRREEIGNMDSI